MVESAIALPLAILIVVLLVRIFAFYMEILDTSICSHLDAMRECDEYTGKIVRFDRSEDEISMFGGSILHFELTKKLETKTYHINEDFLVRTNEILD